ncbi:MAG: hypothetical protein MSC30_05025 [Gaiellaceae bacterium MAG52_C11]|nr:hypothetical protein [Candidatus Gaiellasilicea maunaloa]
MEATMVFRSKWFLPLFSVALGLAFGGALWAGGEPRAGIQALVLMTVVGLIFLVGGRSEMIRGLRGDGRDEYWQRLDVHATALAGHVVIAAILVMCMWEWAHGRDGSPYTQLGAITAVAYILALGVLRWRS